MESIFRIKRKALNSRVKSFSEEELILKSISGDLDAFGDLIKLHKEYLYKTAYVYVKDSDKALDILHECIYRAIKNIKKLHEPKYFKTWITRILINVAVTSLKKDNKIVFLEESNPLLKESESINVEEKLDLYNAIDVLKQDFKNVVIMKYFNEMSIEEISDVLDIPPNTVKTRLSIARKALKNILKEEYQNE